MVVAAQGDRYAVRWSPEEVNSYKFVLNECEEIQPSVKNTTYHCSLQRICIFGVGEGEGDRRKMDKESEDMHKIIKSSSIGAPASSAMICNKELEIQNSLLGLVLSILSNSPDAKVVLDEEEQLDFISVLLERMNVESSSTKNIAQSIVEEFTSIKTPNTRVDDFVLESVFSQSEKSYLNPSFAQILLSICLKKSTDGVYEMSRASMVFKRLFSEKKQQQQQQHRNNNLHLYRVLAVVLEVILRETPNLTELPFEVSTKQLDLAVRHLLECSKVAFEGNATSENSYITLLCTLIRMDSRARITTNAYFREQSNLLESLQLFGIVFACDSRCIREFGWIDLVKEMYEKMFEALTVGIDTGLDGKTNDEIGTEFEFHLVCSILKMLCFAANVTEVKKWFAQDDILTKLVNSFVQLELNQFERVSLELLVAEVVCAGINNSTALKRKMGSFFIERINNEDVKRNDKSSSFLKQLFVHLLVSSDVSASLFPLEQGR